MKLFFLVFSLKIALKIFFFLNDKMSPKVLNQLINFVGDGENGKTIYNIKESLKNLYMKREKGASNFEGQ